MKLLRIVWDGIRRWFQCEKPLTVEEAQRRGVCRICKLNSNPSPGNPLVLNYGEEFAHAQCLGKAKSGAVSAYFDISQHTSGGKKGKEL